RGTRRARGAPRGAPMPRARARWRPPTHGSPRPPTTALLGRPRSRASQRRVLRGLLRPREVDELDAEALRDVEDLLVAVELAEDDLHDARVRDEPEASPARRRGHVDPSALD